MKTLEDRRNLQFDAAGDPDKPLHGTHSAGRSRVVLAELTRHVPFTALGTASGILLVLVILFAGIPRAVSEGAFWTLHPLHVLLSALVTAAMYRLHGGRGWWQILVIGYVGSVGVATVSDSLIPFAGEWLLDMPRRGLHLGFIEKWWLVNPLAIVGTVLGAGWPHTRLSHAAHVLLSTWASLFHITMAMGDSLNWIMLAPIAVFLFLAVWLPCCFSDIVFPVIFMPRPERGDLEKAMGLSPSSNGRSIHDSNRSARA